MLMVAKKKSSKMRGSREHGRGRKKGRGAGLRGGRGNANSSGAKKVHFFKKYGHAYFGKHGFKRPEESVKDVRAVNVGDIARLLPELEAEDGIVSYDGDVAVVDLQAAGFDKLLGGGHVNRAFKVTVEEHTDKALEKLEAAGGEVVSPS